jgi:hypothetical protein
MKSTSQAWMLAGLAFATPAFAHHSYAMFDLTKDVVITGVVADWKWANPHTSLDVLATNDQGAPVTWRLEGKSPQVLRIKGWTRDVIKVGDKITVHLYPLREGAYGGQMVRVTAADGHVYN